MKPSERDRGFVAHLVRTAATSPGALTRLRGRAGDRPADLAALRVLGRWTTGLPHEEFLRYATVAGLFASHPANTVGGNLGACLAEAARSRGPGLTPSLERRFVALLQSHPQELCGHLRRVVGLARSADIPVNWAQLLADLRGWNDPRRRVQLAWARAFWAAECGHPEATDTPTSPYDPPSAVPQPDRGPSHGHGVASAAEFRAILPEPR